MDPLKRIEFSIAPYVLTPGVGAVYAGRKIVHAHQFGFFRADVDTGEVETRVTVGYRQGVFPAPLTGLYVIGDQNQTVVWVAASTDWIVVHNDGNVSGPAPAAFVFRNDAALTLRGIVYAKAGFAWDAQKGNGIIGGNDCYVPNGTGGWEGEPLLYDRMDLVSLQWGSRNAVAPSDNSQKSIDGHTYTLRTEGDPWEGGTFHSVPYVFTRSDVAVEQPPAPAPPPTSPPAPQPPSTEEPPMPVPDVSQPCPPGTFRNPMTGQCDPVAAGGPAPAPTPSPVTPHAIMLHGDYLTEVEFAEPGQPNRKATPIGFTIDTAFWWFLSDNNIEIGTVVVDTERPGEPAVKLLPGTNLYFRVTVTNQKTGKRWTYENPQGQMAGVVAWDAFAQ